MLVPSPVGSSSATGAGSPIIADSVRRISHALRGASDVDGPALYDASIRRSFVLSVDQAHAVHPNYASKHERNHGPRMNGGMVIKRNANQRYATNGVTGLIVRELGRRAGLPPVQEFVVRNDCGCGSTIGPIISTATGIRVSVCVCNVRSSCVVSRCSEYQLTYGYNDILSSQAIDLGCPQLSMHSIRETMGVKDLTHGLALFWTFFANFREVDKSIEE